MSAGNPDLKVYVYAVSSSLNKSHYHHCVVSKSILCLQSSKLGRGIHGPTPVSGETFDELSEPL